MRRWRIVCGLWLATAACACGGEHGSVTNASRMAEPHMAEYARFVSWVARAQHGHPAREQAAVAEAAFAPLRLERGVIAAWIVREDEGPLRVSALPEDAALPEGLRWIPFRDPSLGALRVASAGQCPIDLPSWWRGEIGACVLLSTERSLPGGGTLRTTVAYRPEGAEG